MTLALPCIIDAAHIVNEAAPDEPDQRGIGVQMPLRPAKIDRDGALPAENVLCRKVGSGDTGKRVFLDNVLQFTREG